MNEVRSKHDILIIIGMGNARSRKRWGAINGIVESIDCPIIVFIIDYLLSFMMMMMMMC